MDLGARIEQLVVLVENQGEELRALREQVEVLQPRKRQLKGLLSFRAVARELGIRQATVIEMVRQRQIRTVFGSGTRLKIPRSELQRLQEYGLGRRKRGRPRKVDGNAQAQAAQRAMDQVAEDLAALRAGRARGGPPAAQAGLLMA